MTPLASAIVDWAEQQIAVAAGSPPVLMLSGAQGIGKSTAMAALRSHPRWRIAIIGLDDVYLTKADRIALATAVHPLCETRGPPGSHDFALLDSVLAALRDAGPSSQTPLPHFDKRVDDRAARATWPLFTGRPDAILMEGWLVGALPDPDAATAAPINPLEAQADPDGRWRAWQEAALAGRYAALWDQASAFMHLRAPSFDIVSTWRTQQEETTLGLAPGTLPPERRAWVARFIQHYERITRRMLSGACRPGTVLSVDAARALRKS
jgi:D-glycerate 3-kinase